MKKEEGGMGIFCNNFWELGDPNQKSFFGRGGELARVTGPRGPMRSRLFGQAGPTLAKSKKFYLGLRQQPTPGGVGCCGWVG